MTDEELAAIGERWARAVPGPWRDLVTELGVLCVEFGPDEATARASGMFGWYVVFGTMEDTESEDHRTAAAVAAAPSDVAALLNEVRRLHVALREQHEANALLTIANTRLEAQLQALVDQHGTFPPLGYKLDLKGL